VKRIVYAGGSFLTSDRVAETLFDYAALLARLGTGERVSVPGIGAGDVPVTFELVIGPASQLLGEDEEVPFADLEDDAFLADIEKRRRDLDA
jgi:hypothetical protein